MSLRIGNLSSRIRRDELERVFQRYGRCYVWVKNGFGFVRYCLPSNAEKALRALHKKYICGEPLTLMWSNEQHRPLKRLSQQGGAYRRGDYGKRKLGSNNQLDYKIRENQPASDGRRFSVAGMRDEETAYLQGDMKDYKIGEERHGEDFVDEDGRVEPEPEPEPEYHERWGEQKNENGDGNVLEFDRYEPHEGYNGTNDGENCHMTYPGGSLTVQNPEERVKKNFFGEQSLNCSKADKPQQTCFKCGKPGHKWRNCPQETASQRKFNKFDRRDDDDTNRRVGGRHELEIFESRSWEKGQSSRDAVRTVTMQSDMKLTRSGKHQQFIRSRRSPVAKETNRSREKDDHEQKKQSRKELVSPRRQRTKRARSASSSHHSNFTASRLQSISRSPKHVQQPHSPSRSRSLSARPCSFSSDSRPGSKSQYSRSKSSKSRSRSSPSEPLSLSVMPDQPLPKGRLDVKGLLDNDSTPQFEDIFMEPNQNHGLDNDKLKAKIVALSDDKGVSSCKADSEKRRSQPLEKDNDDYEVEPESSYEKSNPSTPLSEKGTLALADRTSSPERLLEIQECQNSDAGMIECVPVATKKPDSEDPASSGSGHLTSISSEELCMVLKHYGLDQPDENRKHLPAEAYFGSARFWPWELIYYRRLKKGPISIENYGRRVEQNREFGIVDKYIRGSSGWGELSQENQ